MAPKDNSLVCTTLEPGQAPSASLSRAGLEPGFEGLLQHEAPAVDLVGPTSLPSGGAPVLISGSGFTPATAVYFGAAPARSVIVLSGNYLVASAPPGTGGVTVSVTTAGGASAPTKGSTVTYSSSKRPSPRICRNMRVAVRVAPARRCR